MPKISAPTVAEHRANQSRLLLDAAHEILKETGQAPTMAEVADKAGLSRSSMYQYFESRTDMLNQLVQDLFPMWTEAVTGAMEKAGSPAQAVLAYAEENVRLVARGAHAIGSALAASAPSEALDQQAARMHREVRRPLDEALAELGIEDVEAIAELVNATVHASTQMLETGRDLEAVLANLRFVLEPMVGCREAGGQTR